MVENSKKRGGIGSGIIRLLCRREMLLKAPVGKKNPKKEKPPDQRNYFT